MLTAPTIERNTATARKLIEEVINTGRLGSCDRYLAADRADYQNYGLAPGMADGHEGFKRVVGPIVEAFPDLHLEVEFTVADGDRVVLYISTTGTNTGPFLGRPPTGKKFKVNQVDIFRFDDEGKVAAHWGVFDTFGMMAQLDLNFSKHVIKHRFCSECGCAPFGFGERSGQAMAAINVRCLEGELSSLKRVPVDGRSL